MKNRNNKLSTKAWYHKLKTWWYNLFLKHETQKYNTENPEITDVKSKKMVKDKNRVDVYKEKYERRMYLLDLQKKYKNKEILEASINEADRIDLENLFIEQNDELKRRIITLERKISKIKADNRKG